MPFACVTSLLTRSVADPKAESLHFADLSAYLAGQDGKDASDSHVGRHQTGVVLQPITRHLFAKYQSKRHKNQSNRLQYFFSL